MERNATGFFGVACVATVELGLEVVGAAVTARVGELVTHLRGRVVVPALQIEVACAGHFWRVTYVLEQGACWPRWRRRRVQCESSRVVRSSSNVDIGQEALARVLACVARLEAIQVAVAAGVDEQLAYAFDDVIVPAIYLLLACAAHTRQETHEPLLGPHARLNALRLAHMVVTLAHAATVSELCFCECIFFSYH